MNYLKNKTIRCAINVIVLSFLSVANFYAQSETLLKLWYDKPAKQWIEALPIGNGRLGAMVYGDPQNEIIQLNESTVWAGQPHRNDNLEAKEALPIVRKLLFEGKSKEAQDIINQKFISKNSHGMPYQTVGNLNLTFPNHSNYKNYYRELNIENAISTTIYEVDGVTFKREILSSFPDQVIVLRISASENEKINFTATMNRPTKVDVKTIGNDLLIMSGITTDCDSIKGALKFQANVKIKIDGGKIFSNDSSLTIQNSNEAIIFISIASSYKNYNDISGDPNLLANSYLENTFTKDFNQIKSNHISDFQKYFNRVSIDLGITDSVKNPTNIRIKNFANGNDPQLASLYFQFGRYLLISSSRPGGQPTNLQGIWCKDLYPPWDSKYTVNINTEMNYWPSEPTNLSEMNEPFIQMIKEVSESGRKTAKDMYGANGWMLHHNTDLWRITGPVDGAYWGMWPMASAWFCQHLFEKYEYSGDEKYLANIYPVMKGAVEFYLDFLIEELKNKWLVVSPSNSPENSPSIHPESSISYGTTMDNQLLFDLFSKTIKAAKILKTDNRFIDTMNSVLAKLPPMQIGQHSQLQEWIEDWDNPEDKHRHVSHLYGAFPSNQISAFRTPELFDAARTSLIYRGDPSTGWSMNWKINLWANFLDGNHAYKLIKDQINLVEKDSFEKGGTYTNMFDAHPPFQIDGNFGFTSGITEMLMQSDDGAIFILPALPNVWENGSISGLRARGGFVVEKLEWKDSKIANLIIKSTIGGNCRIRVYDELNSDNNFLKIAEGENSNSFYQTPKNKAPLISDKAKLNKLNIRETFLYDIQTEVGQSYEFTIK
ncbi:MAG: glycoside hydrolase family 95 protein [Ignavibacteriae bacterium]|nr:glycoside hydrolase family 95 protein [Ignavibacteriota bacterium]